jgi:hypothetical protein
MRINNWKLYKLIRKQALIFRLPVYFLLINNFENNKYIYNYTDHFVGTIVGTNTKAKSQVIDYQYILVVPPTPQKPLTSSGFLFLITLNLNHT